MTDNRFSDQRALTSSGGGPGSAPTADLATGETPWSTDVPSDNHAYRVRVMFSVRSTDGTLTRFARMSPLTSSGQ